MERPSLVIQTSSTLDVQKCEEDVLATQTIAPVVTADNAPEDVKHGRDFWLGFVAALSVDFFCAFQLTVVATILPTVVGALNGTDFIWPGSAYAVASTAINPLCGGLASAFGRKPVLLAFIALFSLGSVVCGAAQNMSMLIAGRTIQGLGGGGCACMTEIIYADLVPVAERGKILAFQAAVWALGVVIAPLCGGALAGVGAWRWVFLLNLPMAALAAPLVYFFLHLHTPRTALLDKLLQIDWLGNALIIGSTTATMVGLSWAGTQFAWTSVQVLIPLIIGGVGIIAFFAIELWWIKNPTIPRGIVADRSMFSGYITTFIHGIVSTSAIYFLPVYFQACKGASTLRSGIDFFGVAFSLPIFAVLTGTSIGHLKRYRPQNYIGWIFTLIGFGLFTLLDVHSTQAQYFGFQIVLGIGVGIIYQSAQFAITAPLATSQTAQAISLFIWTRSFAQSWGTLIGGAILQNQVMSHLPGAFLLTLPHGADVTYQIIPRISPLPEPLRDEVRAAYAQALGLLWRVMLGFSGAGLLACGLMREDAMTLEVDETWGYKEDGQGQEQASGDETRELHGIIADV